MPKAYFLPERVEVEVQEGETLLHAAKAAGIPHVNVCGGLGRCSTCRVIVLDGLQNCSAPGKDEQDIGKMLNLPPNVRLTCQTTITGPVKVRRLVEDLADVDFFSIFIEGVEVLTALGEEKDIFILFADIQAFTAFAENLLPYDVLYSLNLYLRQMGEIVKRHDGRIDNYMGDGFMALFEADSPAVGARRAIQAALEMLVEVKRLAALSGGILPPQFRYPHRPALRPGGGGKNGPSRVQARHRHRQCRQSGQPHRKCQQKRGHALFDFQRNL